MERQTITGSLSTSGRLSGALSVGGGTTDYNELENKPTYNGHVIEGELTSESLGIWQPKNFSTEEQNTGIKWIDGRDIFVKSFTFNTITIPSNTWFSLNNYIDIQAYSVLKSMMLLYGTISIYDNSYLLNYDGNWSIYNTRNNVIEINSIVLWYTKN